MSLVSQKADIGLIYNPNDKKKISHIHCMLCVLYLKSKIVSVKLNFVSSQYAKELLS